jgi:hypothetical protein
LAYFGQMRDHEAIRERFAILSRHLDERGRRMFAAAEAKAGGYGGIAAASRATGIAVSTIGRAKKPTILDVSPDSANAWPLQGRIDIVAF